MFHQVPSNIKANTSKLQFHEEFIALLALITTMSSILNKSNNVFLFLNKKKNKPTYCGMSPELDNIMHTVAAGIQQMILSPLFPVYFKGFILVHAEFCDKQCYVYSEISS